MPEFLVFSKEGKDLYVTAHHANGIKNKRYLSEFEEESIGRTLGLPNEEGVFRSIPDKDYWKIMTTSQEREGWLNSWQQLSPEEKLVFVTNHYRVNSYKDVAEGLGFTDIEEIRIGLCGSNNVIITHRSEQFQQMLKGIEEKMTTGMVEKGILSATDLPWKLRKRMVTIQYAIEDMLTENIEKPSVGSTEWEEWYRKTQDTFYNFLIAQ